jgi:3-methyladenine DNA glycosylase/8-oxoguanine DNA glycosylase
MGEEEIVKRLTRVRGIGRWTVQILLVFRLGRPDVLPA